MTINAINIIPCKTAGCPTMGDYAISKKMNVKWGSHKVGDIVLFDFNGNGTSDHIGIVVKVGSGYIETVEGNTSSDSKGSQDNGGGVFRRKRYKSSVNYFVRPKYNDEVTAEMVVQTAIAEIGTKESPKNSNKVKYNQWFYGKNTSAYWCCTFVCWVFAHVKGEIKPIPKPTGKYAGLIPEGLFKIGSKGDKVLQLQKFLNWYGADCGKADGEFGNNTYNGVCVFQKTEGLDVDGEFGANSYAKAITYKEKVKEYYTGAFPDLIVHSRNYLQQVAKELAWAKGTKASKYNYKGGSPVAKFKTALNKVFPDRGGWGNKTKVGASCDVFVGTVMRYSGCDPDWKRGLDGQFGKTPKHCSVTTNIKEAQMIYYKKPSSQHTRMIVDIGGVLYNCEANHNYKGGQYGHIGSKTSKPSGTTMLKMFKVTSAFRAISFGDLGSEVTKLQKFLNWAGYDCGTADGDFGDKTKGAVKSFQYDNGLTSDGEFGSKSLAKAKEIKR